MSKGRDQTMGKIVARAWTDAGFKARLLANPAAAIAELGLGIPKGKTMAAVENTSTLTHIVLTSPRYVETGGAYADIKEFGESYTDPRLFPFKWGSHDPVFAARCKADARAALAYRDVLVPDAMALAVVENSRTHAHLVLPAQPDDPQHLQWLLGKIAEEGVPPTMRYAGLFPAMTYAELF